MRYLEYKEQRTHRTQEFPFAYYHESPTHPRYNMVYHWHPEYEFIRILEGSMKMRLDGGTIFTKAGDVLLVTDGVLHEGIPTDCVYECIVFDMQEIFPPNLCDAEMLSILKHKKSIKSLLTSNTNACEFIHKMFEAMARQPKGYRHQVLGALHGFFGEVICDELYQTLDIVTPKGQKQMIWLKNTLEMIRSEYHENLSLEAMANCAQLNQKYFCRQFRAMTGRTPIDYLNYCRIESACERITISEKNITEIALECGFNDGSYFVKVFKRYKGMTPSQYARENRV